MVFILQRFPTSLCVFLTSPVAFVFYLFARAQRRAVRANLRALFPERGALRCWLGAYQVFRQFALTYLDRLLYRHCRREVEWDVQGMEFFEQMKNEPGGVLVFTVHSGNYDIGSSRAGGKARTALAHRAGAGTQPVTRCTPRGRTAGRQQPAAFAALPLQHPGQATLASTCCRLLLAGEIVGVQGDRVVMDVSPLAVVHEGVSYTIPLGPLLLAETARVPCYTIFLTRFGVCRYRIEVSQAVLFRAAGNAAAGNRRIMDTAHGGLPAPPLGPMVCVRANHQTRPARSCGVTNSAAIPHKHQFMANIVVQAASLSSCLRNEDRLKP